MSVEFFTVARMSDLDKLLRALRHCVAVQIRHSPLRDDEHVVRLRSRCYDAAALR